VNNRRSPNKNRFLSKLLPATYEQLLPDLELVAFIRDGDLYHHTGVIDYIYFPVTSIVAMVNVLQDGTSPEVAAIGNDGLIGTNLLLGTQSPTTKFIVQSAGFGYRIKADLIKKLFDSETEFRDLTLRYVHLLMSQSIQIAACNRYHNIDQQLCRFLLSCLDRWNSNRISLTHQRVADLLGVRRASISEASAKLADAGYIQYHRGCVTILDRAGLEKMVCECYQVIKSESDDLLSQ